MAVKKAMLLAAGLGTRLRPMTLTTPKPLLPLDGACLIDQQLRFLAKAGVLEVMINIHHLGEKIRRHVGDGARYGLEIRYSEEPEILGTGGGIKKAAGFFGEEPFFALNADALTDADAAAAATLHVSSDAAATMVVKELSAGETYNPLEVGGDGFVKGFGRGSHFFTGLQVLGPEMLSALPEAGTVSCLIRDGYEKLIREKKPVRAFAHAGYFNDLGTFERYDAARRDVAEGKFVLLA
ncbi:MAG TPA: sugar phosphate nucleotidyltransferase [bacterium]|nr:sugar phosphate nucleotidyltransferase [bacterium]